MGNSKSKPTDQNGTVNTTTPSQAVPLVPNEQITNQTPTNTSNNPDNDSPVQRENQEGCGNGPWPLPNGNQGLVSDSRPESNEPNACPFNQQTPLRGGAELYSCDESAFKRHDLTQTLSESEAADIDNLDALRKVEQLAEEEITRKLQATLETHTPKRRHRRRNAAIN